MSCRARGRKITSGGASRGSSAAIESLTNAPHCIGGPRDIHRVLDPRLLVRMECIAARGHRVKKLDIRPLPDTAREQLVERWRKVQALFVDDPRAAISRAGALIGEAMAARGYPVSDFERRAADVSVEHPRVVVDYR